MRIREPERLSSGFIARAVAAHSRRVEQEARANVAPEHRQLHIDRIVVLAQVVALESPIFADRMERKAILR